MASNLKQVRIFDLNLYSGSSESIRQELKGIHYNFNGMAFEEASSLQVTNAIEGYDSPISVEYNNFDPMPFKRYGVQFFGYSANIRSDEEWAKYFTGGEFADVQYPGIYNNRVYSDHFVNIGALPYKPSETALLNNTIDPGIVLTTEYYQNYERYQSHVATLESELMIPNYYLLDASLFAVSSSDFNLPRHQYPYIKQYLNDTFVNEERALADSLNKKNIFLLDSTFLEDQNNTAKLTDSNYVASEEDLSQIYSLMPFSNKLELSSELTNVASQNLFKQAIQDNSYEYKFIKILKEAFQEETSLSTSTVNFGLNVVEQKGITATSYGTSETTQTIPLKVLDVPTAMVYSYKNNISETNDDFVIDGENYEEQINIFSDTDGIYSALNTERTLGTFNAFREIVKQNYESFMTYGSPRGLDFSAFLNQANETKYHETMAFRIQKIGGRPTGDSRTENTIQNIWFYNRNQAIKYLDTQVKYNTQYTYKVFSYVLVQGYKYQLSDLSVSRRLSEQDTEPESTQPPVYCLELYSPFTGETMPRKAGVEAVSPEVQTAITELTNRLRMTNTDLGTIESLQQQNFDFRYQVYNEVTSATDEKIYATGSISVRDTEITTYLFDDEAEQSAQLGALVETLGGFEEIYTLEDTDGDGDVDLDDLTAEQRATYDTSYDALLATAQTVTTENKMDVIEIANIDQAALDALSGSVDVELSEIRESLSTLDPFQNVETNSLFNQSQLLVNMPYVAEINVSVESSLKILEIPLDEKQMRIIDHAPNDLVVSPHHLMDQSNRLGFYMKYDTFSADTVSYPPPITTQDVSNESSYKIGKDFAVNSKTKEQSVSRPRFIQVYRMVTKPTSYRDFDGNLRKTIDLRGQSGDIASDMFYNDFVETNKKYYYVFRIVNSNGVSGTPSDIFESELINDGGYVYGSFKQMSESELVEPPPTEPSISFKKLINIVPNIQHLTLNTNADMFSDASTDHLGDISLGSEGSGQQFWDQQFKIRLTSKKTGRKIDLNLKFEIKDTK
jgi:hypothetical protein